jgi:hypothetical protein
MTDLPPIPPAAEAAPSVRPDQGRIRGKFAPGFSGNPAGMRKGSRHRRTLLLEGMLTEKGQEVLNKIIVLALAGNEACLRICAERLLPPRKSMPIKFRLPPLNSISDAQNALAMITRGMSQGKILSDEAQVLSSVVSSFVRTIEASTLENRIAALERGEKAVAEEAPRYDA